MSKRKATFTKQTAAENQAILQRLNSLMAGVDPGSDAREHTQVFETIKAEHPAVSETRIWSKIDKAIRILRGRAIRAKRKEIK